MTTGFDSYPPVAVPQQRAFDDTGFDGAVDAPAFAPTSRIGHPRPARHSVRHLFGSSGSTTPAADAGPVPDAAPGARPGLRFARAGITLLVVVLVGVVAWQAYQLQQLADQASAADKQIAQAVAADRAVIAGLQARASDLESTAARAFDPEAISAAVLPSVFRVRAGNFTGSAFAVGDKAKAGQANLLTNFHVVKSVWDAGSRKVFLERGGVEVSAEIIKVDKDVDLAQLRVHKKIAGLARSTETVKPGQPVMAVGAPLGLEDTVTTGVISAVRKDKDAGNATIQFDAPINPGNSGGPVINSAKQVVGLATAKARDAEGISLAIPIKEACDTFDIC
jgi:putative serine protease PepD